ncbi:MAG: peptidase [Nitrosopumilus sp.]|nr:peptidase [Nitrosopumilus sp.]MDH3340678.1 peptidase [Nitrosopumilus sp.]
MKATIIAISTILLVGSITSFATAQEVPAWVKNNAGWWADGTISETEFVSGIQHLIKEGILIVPPTTVSTETTQQGIPAWVKNNAGWWADGTITDGEFVNGIQHLIKTGIVNTPSQSTSSQQESNTPSDSELVALQAELDKCAEITKAYDRLNCERAAKHEITAYQIKGNSQVFPIGPVTYYWPGLGSEGNSFEITSSGQALLSLRILVENTGSTQNEALFCTGPAICNYDITNGDKVFKYSQMDFTSGQLVLKPGESKIFNMMFGPNIGGGGTTFEYDSGKDYYFQINESFGSASIPLNLG